MCSGCLVFLYNLKVLCGFQEAEFEVGYSFIYLQIIYFPTP